MSDRLEEIARELEATGNYRVLRRLVPRTRFAERNAEEAFIGVVVDTETTGLDVSSVDVIELGMVKFEYSPEGKVFRLLDSFSQLQQPQNPIPEEIVRITGITDEMVAGQRIIREEVDTFLSDVVLAIAHNARFDRPICERFWPVFENLNWACSMVEIPWRQNGFEGSRLGYLLNDYGLFHDGHRASDDCHALLHLLASPFGATGVSALQQLLTSARRASIRLWACDAPFEHKDTLKARGYRWDNAETSPYRAWWKDIPEAGLDEELDYLTQEIFAGQRPNLPQIRLTARDRYSNRICEMAKFDVV